MKTVCSEVPASSSTCAFWAELNWQGSDDDDDGSKSTPFSELPEAKQRVFCIFIEYFGSIDSFVKYVSKCMDSDREGFQVSDVIGRNTSFLLEGLRTMAYRGASIRADYCGSECLSPALGVRQALLKAMPRGCDADVPSLDDTVDPFVEASAMCARATNSGARRCAAAELGGGAAGSSWYGQRSTTLRNGGFCTRLHARTSPHPHPTGHACML